MKNVCKNCGAKENNWEKYCSDCKKDFCYQCIDDHACREEKTEDNGTYADHLEEVDRD